MTEASTLSMKKTAWVNIAFFIITSGVALFAAPFYLYHSGISTSELLLTVFYTLATGLSVTVGYHRLFAHCAFKANRFVQFLALFFGAASFEQSALKWASQHRDHHQFTDTDKDPYNIKNGFFYAHMGWLMFRKRQSTFANVHDLQKNPVLMHQNKYYPLWAFGSGIILPVMIGALTGHAWGAFILAVCLRITLVYQTTFLINSLCHMFGTSTYDIHSTAKDNWFTALLTYGEGYHNFHHRFPSDYRNGVRWFHWDPSKWLIVVMEKLGMAWDLKRVSKFRIMEARLAGENQRILDFLLKIESQPHALTLRATFVLEYEKLRQHLIDWEHHAKEHQEILRQTISKHSEAFRFAALQKRLAAQTRFEKTRQQWRSLYIPLLATA